MVPLPRDGILRRHDRREPAISQGTGFSQLTYGVRRRWQFPRGRLCIRLHESCRSITRIPEIHIPRRRLVREPIRRRRVVEATAHVVRRRPMGVGTRCKAGVATVVRRVASERRHGGRGKVVEVRRSRWRIKICPGITRVVRRKRHVSRGGHRARNEASRHDGRIAARIGALPASGGDVVVGLLGDRRGYCVSTILGRDFETSGGVVPVAHCSSRLAASIAVRLETAKCARASASFKLLRHRRKIGYLVEHRRSPQQL
eukprot:scaffold477_cov355-Pinguiococcus_pyrenoidosus.AAC.7